MGKSFNRKQFQKGQKAAILCSVIIWLIAIASIACSFFVTPDGNGLEALVFGSKGDDPKDYYGTYYGVKDEEYWEFEFTEKQCRMTQSCGLSLNSVTTRNRYDYVTNEYAKKKIENAANYANADKNYPAILIYSSDNKSATVLWVTSTKPYKFEIAANETEVTSSEINFDKRMGDPKNYYGTYRHGNNYLEISYDNTARYCQDGDTEEYKCAFVNNEWMRTWTKYSYVAALILYRDNEQNFYIFQYVDGKRLITPGGTYYDRDGAAIVSNASDPKDYYGKYYGVCDETYYTLDIGANGCTTTVSCGFPLKKTTRQYSYKYYTAPDLKGKLGTPYYSSKPGIILDDGDAQVVLYVMGKNPYYFNVITVDGQVMSVDKKEIDFASGMGDPKDYYNTYRYNSSNYIKLYSSGMADYCVNGTTKTYSYAYVNYAWLSEWTTYSYDAAIVLYTPGSSLFIIFEYISNQKLRSPGGISYTKSSY